jgi:hypothetical protein
MLADRCAPWLYLFPYLYPLLYTEADIFKDHPEAVDSVAKFFLRPARWPFPSLVFRPKDSCAASNPLTRRRSTEWKKAALGFVHEILYLKGELSPAFFQLWSELGQSLVEAVGPPGRHALEDPDPENPPSPVFIFDEAVMDLHEKAVVSFIRDNPRVITRTTISLLDYPTLSQLLILLYPEPHLAELHEVFEENIRAKLRGLLTFRINWKPLKALLASCEVGGFKGRRPPQISGLEGFTKRDPQISGLEGFTKRDPNFLKKIYLSVVLRFFGQAASMHFPADSLGIYLLNDTLKELYDLDLLAETHLPLHQWLPNATCRPLYLCVVDFIYAHPPIQERLQSKCALRSAFAQCIPAFGAHAGKRVREDLKSCSLLGMQIQDLLKINLT